jgi:N-carbamoyl-L-amino-acid hydrolase
MQITVDLSRLLSELETLASFSDAPDPAVTRIVFSAQDLAARAYLRQLFSEAALELRTDAVGNTFARWRGTDPSLAPVATGSHTDAVPHAGRYDGTVGVLGGLEAIRALQRSGFRPRRSVELLVFTSEEPTRFGIGCLGSRMLSGTLSPENARLLKDGEGKSLEEILRQAALHGSVELGSVKDGSLENVRLAKDYYHAFVELHIEQGPLLELKGIPVGIVTAIAAPAALRVTIEGAGGHAGAVLMPDRRDAFLAAAEIALAVESAAKATRSVDSVATTGVCNVFPGAVNSIPSRAVLEIDVRDIDLARRDGMLGAIRAACETVAAKRQVRVEVELINADAPAQASPLITEALSSSCQALGIEFMPMVSRAYHDSLFMSRIAPTGMLFIPCRNGFSHRPDEYAAPEDIKRGVQVLASALAQLAQ